MPVVAKKSKRPKAPTTVVAIDARADRIIQAIGLVNPTKIASVRTALAAHWAGTTPLADGLKAWQADCLARQWACRPGMISKIVKLANA